jgi:hypothetical protein
LGGGKGTQGNGRLKKETIGKGEKREMETKEEGEGGRIGGKWKRRRVRGRWKGEGEK